MTTEQIASVKAQNPHCLAVFRIGDFYEFFGDDAHVASKCLGLTLTARNKESAAPLPMCGFPYHQLASYLKRLIALKHRVAVCSVD